MSNCGARIRQFKGSSHQLRTIMNFNGFVRGSSVELGLIHFATQTHTKYYCATPINLLLFPPRGGNVIVISRLSHTKTKARMMLG